MTRTKLTLSVGIVFAAFTAANTPAFAGFGDNEQERQQRWNDLQKQIFGDRKALTDDRAVSLDVPGRAEDAALVPITITMADPKNVKGLYLVIDENPSPVAALSLSAPTRIPRPSSCGCG